MQANGTYPHDCELVWKNDKCLCSSIMSFSDIKKRKYSLSILTRSQCSLWNLVVQRWTSFLFSIHYSLKSTYRKRQYLLLDQMKQPEKRKDQALGYKSPFSSLTWAKYALERITLQSSKGEKKSSPNSKLNFKETSLLPNNMSNITG